MIQLLIIGVNLDVYFGNIVRNLNEILELLGLPRTVSEGKVSGIQVGVFCRFHKKKVQI